jgi:hypothetical protein
MEFWLPICRVGRTARLETLYVSRVTGEKIDAPKRKTLPRMGHGSVFDLQGSGWGWVTGTKAVRDVFEPVEWSSLSVISNLPEGDGRERAEIPRHAQPEDMSLRCKG